MFDNLEVKLYKKRNMHSMKEHKYERYATYFLLLMLFIMVLGLVFKAEIICFYILLPFVIVATIMRLLAWYHHSKERKIHKIIKEKNL